MKQEKVPLSETPLDPEAVLEDFEAAWQAGDAPDLEAFLPPMAAGNAGDARLELLADLIKLDLEYRWRSWQPTVDGARLEEYTARYPELSQAPLLQDLIGEEYLVRRRWGDRPTHEEYCQRFASHAAHLRKTLAEIDTELAAEFRRKGHTKTPPSTQPVQEVVRPAAPVRAVADLLTALRTFELLGPAELDEVERSLARQHPEPLTLARELVARDRLTPYQMNQLLRGNGPDLVLGPYQLLERLGEGATGSVFKARHRHLQRLVALKVLRRELLQDPEVLGRFYREIRGVSRLSHRHVVHAYDAGPIGGTHILIMEYAPGLDLDRLVRRDGRLPVATAAEYVCQAALGLQHIHEQGLIHRDVKPSNLLLVSAGVVSGEWSKSTVKASTSRGDYSALTPHHSQALVKILDLGLARLGKAVRGLAPGRQQAGVSSACLTPTGAIMIGTPDFLAPEQALDFRQADCRADIYSLGCTFFYLLTGQPPFPGGSLARKLLRHHQSPPPPLDRCCKDVPAAVAAVVSRMLEKEPAARFQTAAQVLDALATALPDSIAPRSARAVAGGSSQKLGPAQGWIPQQEGATVDTRSDEAPAAELPRADATAQLRELSPDAARRGGASRRWRWLVWAVPLVVLSIVGGAALYFGGSGGGMPSVQPTGNDQQLTSGLDYRDGFAGARGLTLNRHAAISGARLRLTKGGNWQVGSAFTTQKLGVGRFSTQFRFQMSKGNTDGFTFTIQSVGPQAIGPPGAGLGYGSDRPDGRGADGIPRSVAVKFDYWNNFGEGNSSTGLYINGASPTVPAINLNDDGLDLRTNHIYQAAMIYEGSILRVTITDDTKGKSATQSYTVDIVRAVGGPSAHVGFTGATGGTTDTPDILSWTFQPF